MLLYVSDLQDFLCLLLGCSQFRKVYDYITLDLFGIRPADQVDRVGRGCLRCHCHPTYYFNCMSSAAWAYMSHRVFIILLNLGHRDN